MLVLCDAMYIPSADANIYNGKSYHSMGVHDFHK